MQSAVSNFIVWINVHHSYFHPFIWPIFSLFMLRRSDRNMVGNVNKIINEIPHCCTLYSLLTAAAQITAKAGEAQR